MVYWEGAGYCLGVMLRVRTCGDALGLATDEVCFDVGFFDCMRFKIACIFYKTIFQRK